jgi:hypothetical protein
MANQEFNKFPLFAQVLPESHECRNKSKCKTCKKAYNKAYYAEHQAEISAHEKRYRQEHRELDREQRRAEYVRLRANPAKAAEYAKKRRINERKRRAIDPKFRDRNKPGLLRTKLLVLGHYSNQTFQCACCAESHLEFLSLDHINGGGHQHRRTVRHVYPWLIKNNYPPGYRVLCLNCNFALGIFGYCPHKTKTALPEPEKAYPVGIYGNSPRASTSSALFIEENPSTPDSLALSLNSATVS